MKDVYIVATEAEAPLPEADLREAFSSEDVTVVFGEDGCLFSIRAEETRVDVRFQALRDGLGWTPELLTGTAEARRALEAAKGFYRVSFVPGKPQGSVAVFEGLWSARMLLELCEGVVVDVTSFKIHTPQDVEELTELDFDIRDHVTVHAQVPEGLDGQYWVHTHGLSKFGVPDVEMFQVREDDLPAAEIFLHELCTDLAFGQGPEQRAIVSTSVGMPFTIVPSEEARNNLHSVPPETFEGHEANSLAVVGADGRHTMSEILAHYRDRFEAESDEEAEALQALVDHLLPAFKARFLRKGLMEPMAFLVRAPFETHPDGEEGEAAEEQLWCEVLAWDEVRIVGKLVDGGQATTEWRRGAHVEIDEQQLTGLAVSRDGRTLDPEELEQLFRAERPA